MSKENSFFGKADAADMQRLGLEPDRRVLVAGIVAGAIGLIHGGARGARISALRYLAENAHRLPRTKGSWYFFHKRRNAVVIKAGLENGGLTALKYIGATTLFVGTEALIDHYATHQATFLGTAGGATLVGATVNIWNKLPMKLALRSTRNFGLLGVAIGLGEDFLRYIRPILNDEIDEILHDTEHKKDQFVKDYEAVDHTSQGS